MKRWEQFVANSERSIRKGHLKTVRLQLRDLGAEKIPPGFRLAVANLARRVGAHGQGLQILRNAVFGVRLASPQILAEYVILLVQSGCVREGLRLLDERRDSHLDLDMARVFCLFERWEHEKAIPILEDSIRRQKETYLRLLARANFAHAQLMSGRLRNSILSLDEVLKESLDAGYDRLAGHCYGLRARAALDLGQFRRAKVDIRAALEKFGDENVIDSILIRLQAAILESNLSKSSLPLRRFRVEAEASHAWECVREVDRQILAIKPQRALHARLYFGTPMSAYRQLLKSVCHFQPAPCYLWGEDPPADVLDLSSGQLTSGRNLSATRQNLTVLDALLRDFYRPQQIGEIFSTLFPDEHFHSLHSPTRVHQALRRFRHWVAGAALPLEVQCRSGTYSLKLTGPLAVRISIEQRRSEKTPTFIGRLKLRFGCDTTFTARQAREALNIPRATMTRYLAREIAAGTVIQNGITYLIKRAGR